MQLSHPSSVVAPGAIIGNRYRVGDLLGRGGMAEVYDGFDTRLQRPVAIKLLRREMAAREDIRARFKAEALAAAGLSHPHAVAVFDTGDHDGLPYLVMERLPGDTLAERIAEGPVDPEWMAAAARGLLGALQAAHDAGIVHRDVKPGNILLAEDGRAKITDFGIAKSIHPGEDTSGDHVDLTATGQLLGTPAYLAPERLEGHRATPRSDLWAFGVVMYEALTTRKPFVGLNPLEVANAVVTGNHVHLDEARPGLDPTLVATVERAMAIAPEDRFATAAEMAAALDETPKSETMVMAAPAPPRTQRVVRPKPKSRKGLIWLLIGAVVLIVALALGWAGRPAIPASSSASTTVAQTLADKMRTLAGQLDPARDGAKAPDLATGLRRVAGDIDAKAAATATDANNLITSINGWVRAGQLREPSAVAALELLRQVPGVAEKAVAVTTTAAPRGAPATTAAPAPAPVVTTAPPTTVAPTTPPTTARPVETTVAPTTAPPTTATAKAAEKPKDDKPAA